MILKDIAVGVLGKTCCHNKLIWTYQGKAHYTNSILPSIYKITNIRNGDFYIGSSYRPFYRLNQHNSKLKNNCHDNKHLQNIYNKYGVNVFCFEIMEVLSENCSRDELYAREQELLDELNPRLNLCKTVITVDCVNRKEIHRYSLEGTYVSSYESITEAGRQLGVSEASIRDMLGGTSVSCKGFLWSTEKVDSIKPQVDSSLSFWKYGKYTINAYTAIKTGRCDLIKGPLIGSWNSRTQFLNDNPSFNWSSARSAIGPRPDRKSYKGLILEIETEEDYWNNNI